MKGFEIIAYTKPDGTVPVNDFLYMLPEHMRAKALRELDLLSEYGNLLREPYSKYLGDGLFELRIKEGTDISRILYFFFTGKRIILTNGFVKKSRKLPLHEKKLAQKYRQDYLKREEQRR